MALRTSVCSLAGRRLPPDSSLHPAAAGRDPQPRRPAQTTAVSMGKRKSRSASGPLPATVSQEPAQLNSDPSAAGPYAVYFPSGFDPATGMTWDTLVEPRRRQSLVVGKTEGVDFVGGSAGDASGALPPPCKWVTAAAGRASAFAWFPGLVWVGRMCRVPACLAVWERAHNPVQHGSKIRQSSLSGRRSAPAVAGGQALLPHENRHSWLVLTYWPPAGRFRLGGNSCAPHIFPSPCQTRPLLCRPASGACTES